MRKEDALLQLHQAWYNCQACGLCQERTNTVYGYGNPDAQLMVVGEAPGETEDRYGVPFIGAAGQLLDLYLGQVSWREDVQIIIDHINGSKKQADKDDNRRQLREILLGDTYFTNIVMCRPPENRDPIPKEIEACKPRLLEQIYTVDPVLIVAAGRIATEALIGKKVAITQARGELFDVEFTGRIHPLRYPVLAVLHPSYLLRRNDFRQKGGEGQKTYNDFVRSMNLIDRYNESHYDMPVPSTRPKMEK